MKGVAILVASVLVAISIGVGVVSGVPTTTPARTTTTLVGTCAASERVVCITGGASGRVTAVRVGETVTVVLVTSSLRLSPPRIVGRLILRPERVVGGARAASASFLALRSGNTTLEATGTPVCSAHEPCPMFVMQWRAVISVTG